MVKKSWKHVPSIPRMEVSANSEMNTGQTTHDPPTAIPKIDKGFCLKSLNFYIRATCLRFKSTYRLKISQHTALEYFEQIQL